jgi:DNA-binding CsgD family transcriptional regulator
VFVSNRSQIARLAAAGHSAAEIARRLGLASPTVDYHLRRLADAAAPVASPDVRADRSRSQIDTRAKVERLLALGLTQAAIAREVGVAKSTVSYHARRLGAPVDERGARRYNWSEVQRYYDAAHSVRDCMKRFGFSRQTWHAATKRGAVVARPRRIPLEELCAAATPRGRRNLKRRLLAAQLKEERCETCGLSAWRGAPIPLALHHVNGDRHDNRLANLQILCPNCHAQTESWARRNPGARGVLTGC